MGKRKDPIAIVGMACRFPGGASSPEAFWECLAEGRDLVGRIDERRWGTEYYYHPNPQTPGRSYTWSAGVLDDIDRFDAAFFGISPREAAEMDPQQRLLLELAWEALEDGAQVPERLAGSDCAVYIGISSTDYANSRIDDPGSGDAYAMTGGTLSIAANRISYVFDLHGPSMAVDTACSSSLVALHQACLGIWRGESASALAGGVNILMTPFSFIGFSKASMLSPTGRCRAFDAAGDGYVRAEGAAVVYLKPLSQARRDGDPVHALILGSAVNSDGRTRGLSMPNPDAQEELLASAYADAGVNPKELVYVEAHGTGTAAGDPQEARAIGRVLAGGRAAGDPLPIGSVKTNLGHLEPASGMAGLLKAVLVLRHRAVPASLHFRTPNPNIPFEELNLRVATEYAELPDDGVRRRSESTPSASAAPTPTSSWESIADRRRARGDRSVERRFPWCSPPGVRARCRSSPPATGSSSSPPRRPALERPPPTRHGGASTTTIASSSSAATRRSLPGAWRSSPPRAGARISCRGRRSGDLRESPSCSRGTVPSGRGWAGASSAKTRISGVR